MAKGSSVMRNRLFALAIFGASISSAWANADVLGIWQGTFVCDQPEGTLTLKIDRFLSPQKFSGELQFAVGSKSFGSAAHQFVRYPQRYIEPATEVEVGVPKGNRSGSIQRPRAVWSTPMTVNVSRCSSMT